MTSKISSLPSLLQPARCLRPAFLGVETEPIEAARLNNLGVAYMNQQLFEKGLKTFQQAASSIPNWRLRA